MWVLLTIGTQVLGCDKMFCWLDTMVDNFKTGVAVDLCGKCEDDKTVEATPTVMSCQMVNTI